ncbi:hypothetical protein R3P38DRAFT_62464 [Favolaschia claudopus]|uniref:Uncharacterized protein n=1 Tax=Favolaschia claudopus TaxID=2862362 RepID=A0AAW0ELI7_9AGAR
MTQVLQKTCDDEWTSAGVKSTFTVNFPEDPASWAPLTFSSICGWGWRFAYTFGLQLDQSATISGRRISVAFNPYLIHHASYGKVTFHTEVENLILIENESRDVEINLPISIPGKKSHSSQNSSTFNQLLQSYLYPENAIGPASISIWVRFPNHLGISFSCPPVPVNMPVRLEEALLQTIHGGDVIDLKFYAYTRAGFTPSGTGYVARPRPLFGKLGFLRGHSESLDAYLSAISGTADVQFSESKIVDLDGEMEVEERFTEYDYMSDSDLDPDEQEEIDIEVRDTDNTSTASEAVEIILSDAHSTSPSTSSQSMKSGRKGRVVIIKGHAYKTWHALIHYLYTNKVTFRTSTSQQDSSPNPECSAKSMYKLAHRFELEGLKALALKAIKAQLSSETIVREAFSSFTSLYPEVLEIEADFLLKHLPRLHNQIDEMLKSICDEMRPNSHAMLRRIVFGRNGGLSATRNVSEPQVSLVTFADGEASEPYIDIIEDE